MAGREKGGNIRNDWCDIASGFLNPVFEKRENIYKCYNSPKRREEEEGSCVHWGPIIQQRKRGRELCCCSSWCFRMLCISIVNVVEKPYILHIFAFFSVFYSILRSSITIDLSISTRLSYCVQRFNSTRPFVRFVYIKGYRNLKAKQHLKTSCSKQVMMHNSL